MAYEQESKANYDIHQPAKTITEQQTPSHSETCVSAVGT